MHTEQNWQNSYVMDNSSLSSSKNGESQNRSCNDCLSSIYSYVFKSKWRSRILSFDFIRVAILFNDDRA